MTRLLAEISFLPVLVLACPALAERPPACLELVVSVRWDADLAPEAQGVVARLELPEGVYVASDGSGSLRANVKDLTGQSGGLFDAVSHDEDEDGRMDRLNVGLITKGIPAGPFVRVSLSCREGAPVPSAGDFTCVSEVSAMHGQIDSKCEVETASAADGV
jgi:hypothetical protein